MKNVLQNKVRIPLSVILTLFVVLGLSACRDPKENQDSQAPTTEANQGVGETPAPSFPDDGMEYQYVIPGEGGLTITEDGRIILPDGQELNINDDGIITFD